MSVKLEPIFSFAVGISEPEVIGETPEGLRANYYLTGGNATGDRVTGKFLPVGGDWVCVRRDGIAVLDVKATIETNDGALIFVYYHGTIDLGEDGYSRFMVGDLPPGPFVARASPRLVTSHPRYLWLNRLYCVGLGKLFPDRSEVTYDVFSLS